MDLVSIEDIRAAAKHIAGIAVRTQLLPSPWRPDLWLKPESLQPIGAFKLRGAQHAVAALPAAVRARGVVTHSSGNHGQALAYAARGFGVPCVVVMPEVAEPVKIAAVRALGAEVRLVGAAERLTETRQLAEQRGMTLLPPFDHPDIIAGQGTIGLEVIEDLPDVDLVLVPVGGGGLASGVAAAVKALRPSVRVFGVEPELAADARDSYRAGRLVTWPTEQTYRTSADGLRTNLSELTLAHLTAHLDGIITVSEEEILTTVGRLARQARLVVEPSGAVSVAGHLYHRHELPAGRTVAVVSGGNIAPELLARLLTD